MATMLELYEKNKNLPFNRVNGSGPDAAVVDAKKFGTKGTPGVGFSSGDQTPYSTGTDKGGAKAPDVAALGAAEGSSVVSPGNRYGYSDAAIGGGSVYLKNGWTDAKLYGDSKPR
jgi:hypothetical protein